MVFYYAHSHCPQLQSYEIIVKSSIPQPLFPEISLLQSLYFNF